MSAEMSAEHAPQCGVGAVGRDVCECVLLSRAILVIRARCVCAVSSCEVRGAWCWWGGTGGRGSEGRQRKASKQSSLVNNVCLITDLVCSNCDL